MLWQKRQVIRNHQDVPSLISSVKCPDTHTRVRSVVATKRDNDRDDGFVDDVNYKVMSAIRSSLCDDLIQPHLDSISIAKSGNSRHIPPVVLLLAVSGGSDSVALFHAVTALLIKSKDSNNRAISCYIDNCSNRMKEVQCELHVAHFNHEQRGDASDEDESFVKKLCVECDIPFHNFSWSDERFPSAKVESYDDEPVSSNLFTQDIARKWRRRKLRELLSDLVLQANNSSAREDNRWGAILTAHHGDDSDETILLKLLRGSHLSNLRGIEARSDGFSLTIDSSSLSASIGYFAKPMLQLRKKDITAFLEFNSLEWREDESNTTNKYKRNKVRNELIPLIRNLAGGERALQKRLSNIDQQSRAISKDLSERAMSYLAAMPSQFEFWLPLSFDLLFEEAFYHWVCNLTDKKLQISYDQINRIKYQLEKYPDSLQWTLDVGDLWRIQRYGNVLKLLYDDIERNRDAADWYIIETKTVLFEVDDPLDSTWALSFSVPLLLESSTFTIKSVKDVGNVKFLPPWKTGKSPIKIKELLRGQKVPLHLRDDSTVLCLSSAFAEQVVAVYLDAMGEDKNGTWIIHSDFLPNKGDFVTRVTLAKATSNHHDTT